MTVFSSDPWWIVLIKVVFVFVFLLAITIFNVWYERRLVGKMQQRKGPIMNGPLGLGQALADGLKLMFKEDFRPSGTDKWVFTVAPLLTGVAAFTGWSVIPLAGEVEMFGVHTRLQLTDMPVAVLFILAVASVGIYGIVLAGWASSSTYSLLGGIRSTAQMISYEISMGLALVAVFLTAGSMSTTDIVESQATTFGGFVSFLHIPQWYVLLLIPSAVVYCIAMVAETNRAPFDLVECEQELVSGFLTDYSGFRYAIYFLAEYINMATVSAVATTLFFGGYRAPWPVPWIIQLNPSALSWLDAGWMGLAWFTLKLLIFVGV
ncbi:MAG: complex I subunit 1/NuoH family protein, partial [Propionibacteriaceae bacterium]